MAYTKHNWVTGEVITAEKLNNLENGVASSVLLLHVTEEENDGVITRTLDKTWKEIKDAIMAGTLVACVYEDFYEDQIFREITFVSVYERGGETYTVEIRGGDFTTDNENGYPSYGDSHSDDGPLA